MSDDLDDATTPLVPLPEFLTETEQVKQELEDLRQDISDLGAKLAEDLRRDISDLKDKLAEVQSVIKFVDFCVGGLCFYLIATLLDRYGLSGVVGVVSWVAMGFVALLLGVGRLVAWLDKRQAARAATGAKRPDVGTLIFWWAAINILILVAVGAVGEAHPVLRAIASPVVLAIVAVVGLIILLIYRYY
jgi:hypothetical protein